MEGSCRLVMQTGLACSVSVEGIRNQTTAELTILLASLAYSDRSIVMCSYIPSSQSCRSDCNGISASSGRLLPLGNA